MGRIIDGEKVCKECGKEFPLSFFPKNGGMYVARCHSCNRKSVTAMLRARGVTTISKLRET